MTPAFLQTAWARLLVGTLARSGVGHAVACPGSRSTPIVAALLELGTIQTQIAIDERAAGYLALGLARATSRPVLVVCTSGTAAANLLPAVVEANLAGVPLLVLTADRPFELQHAHAAQTIDQTQLYGTQVRRFVELGDGPRESRTLRGFRRLLLEAMHAAVFPHPGPVHLNFRARKPLEPCAPKDAEDRSLDEQVQALLGESVPRPARSELSCGSVDLESIAVTCASNRRGLILCGFDAQSPPLDPEALAQFAQATGFPVWLDPSHPLRWHHPAALTAHIVQCADLLWQFDDFTIDHRPQLIVQLGPMMTSPAMEHWLTQVGAESHIILCREGWPDPVGRSTQLVVAEPANVLSTIARRIDALRGGLLGERPWFLEWRGVDTRAAQALDAWFAAQPSERPGELSVIRAVLSACPPGTQLVLGNSLPLREAAIAFPSASRELRTFANRGANGIDGIVSSAVGVALAEPVPTVAVVGDMSFLHDLGSLWSARQITSPFVVVVIDNHGGRIFDQLPIRESVAPRVLDAWTTPHDLDLWAAGLVFGIETSRPKSLAAIADSMREAIGRAGPTLIHVACSPESARVDVDSLRQYLADKLFS